VPGSAGQQAGAGAVCSPGGFAHDLLHPRSQPRGPGPGIRLALGPDHDLQERLGRTEGASKVGPALRALGAAAGARGGLCGPRVGPGCRGCCRGWGSRGQRRRGRGRQCHRGVDALRWFLNGARRTRTAPRSSRGCGRSCGGLCRPRARGGAGRRRGTGSWKEGRT